jgi:hypothetical protein
MADRKKGNELRFLKEFLDIVDLKKCSIALRESPDFEITIENKMIGIEVTEYYIDANHNKGSLSRANDTYDHDNIMKIVNEKVKKNNNLKGIFGSLSFKNQERPKKAELKKFSDDLIKFTAESICKNKNFKEMDLEPTDDYPLLKKFLNLVMLQRMSPPSLWDWDITYCGGISFTEENLMNVIKPKVEKQHRYNHNNFNELWLLVVFGPLFSQAVTPSWDVENKLRNFDKINCMLKTSNFDKVYLYLRSRGNTLFKWPAWIKIKPKTS